MFPGKIWWSSGQNDIHGGQKIYDTGHWGGLEATQVCGDSLVKSIHTSLWDIRKQLPKIIRKNHSMLMS